MLGGRLRLVEAGQPAVVALVQPPRLLHRQLLLSDGVQHDVEGVLKMSRVYQKCTHTSTG